MQYVYDYQYSSYTRLIEIEFMGGGYGSYSRSSLGASSRCYAGLVEKKTLKHEILGSLVVPILNVFEHTTVIVLYVVLLEWSI